MSSSNYRLRVALIGTGEQPASRPRCTPVVQEKAQEILDKEDKDFSGVVSTAKTACVWRQLFFSAGGSNYGSGANV